MATVTAKKLLDQYLADQGLTATVTGVQYTISLNRLEDLLDKNPNASGLQISLALLKNGAIKENAEANLPAGGDLTSSVAGNVQNAKDTIEAGEGEGGEGEGGEPTPADFTLTKANNKEVINGTAESEVFDATELGSLQDDDIIIDASSTDNDVLNAAVNGNATKSRIQNVETINLKGEYLDVGFDLINVSGTKTLNLSTKIAGGTGTVTNANSMNAEKIVAGENVGTLAITSLASGTRDTVTVDAGNATKVNLTGVAAGADSYDVKLAENATVVLATTTYASPGDKLRLDLAGGKNNVLETDAAGAADNKALALTLNASTADAVVDLTNGAGASLAAKTIEVTGSKNVTLVSKTGASLKGDGTVGAGNESITNTGSGTATIKITGTLAAGQTFQAAQVDVFEIAKGADAATGTLTLNENTKLNLAGAIVTGDLTLNIDYSKQNTTGFTASTARVDVSEAQTKKLITGANVKTVLVNVTPDETTDTDKDENGHKESSLTLAELDISAAATTAAVIQGSENLVISTLTMNADDVLAASNMTGNLTLTSVAAGASGKKATIVGGKGNTTIGGLSADVFDIQISAGDKNNIILTGAADGTKVTATGGTSTITSVGGTAAGDITIKLADGNDTVTVGKNNTVTLGGGNDTVKLADNLAGVVVKDFVLGTDTIVLSGVQATGNIDLSKVAAPTKGAYFISGAATAAGVWGITLENGGTGLTATDLRNSVQLDITAKDASTVIAGDLNDIVAVKADESATITTGGGKDKVVLNAGDQTTATVKDFTVGSDTIVVTGALSDNFGVNLKNVAEASGAYTIGDGGSGNKGAIFTLQNGGKNITTDGDLTGIVQLGNKAGSTITYLKVVHAGSASENVVVTGGSSNDFVELAGNAKMWTATVGVVDSGNANKQAVFQFSNNGGMDTIKLSAMDGTDLLNFNSLSGIDTSVGKVDLAASAAKVGDAIDGAVYIFADSSAGAAGAKITTLVAHDANGYTQDVINAEVAAFINAGLGVSAGEKYVVIINDNSTATYGTKAWGGGTTEAANSYIYLVDGTNDGVSADNITLIGQLYNAGTDATAAVVL